MDQVAVFVPAVVFVNVAATGVHPLGLSTVNVTTGKAFTTIVVLLEFPQFPAMV